jgi:DNA-binding NarL/FixJ family response regulator
MTNLTLAPDARSGSSLTERERQVATLVCAGLANKEIARQLSLCEGTVKQHAHSIYRKFHVSNRSRLIIAMMKFEKIER